MTFTFHLHIPTILCPTFSRHTPGRIFSTLETLVSCLPGVGLTEINSFLSLPLDFVSGKWPSLVCLGLIEQVDHCLGVNHAGFCWYQGPPLMLEGQFGFP